MKFGRVEAQVVVLWRFRGVEIARVVVPFSRVVYHFVLLKNVVQDPESDDVHHAWPYDHDQDQFQVRGLSQRGEQPDPQTAQGPADRPNEQGEDKLHQQRDYEVRG